MFFEGIKADYRRLFQEAKTNCEECYHAFQNEQNSGPNLVYTTADLVSFNGEAINALQKIINIPINNKNREDFSDEEKKLLGELEMQKSCARQALEKCRTCKYESKRIIRVLESNKINLS